VLLAAGQGNRLATATGGTPKQFLTWKGEPLWWACAKALAASPCVSGLVAVFSPELLDESTAELTRRDRQRSLGIPWRTTAGGPRRQDSVYLGLEALPSDCAVVLVHDSARPFVTPSLITRVVMALPPSPNVLPHGMETPRIMGVVPGLPVTDTIKQTRSGPFGPLVVQTPERANLRAVQTPQVFPLFALKEAHARAQAEGWEVTDDAALMERCGHTVLVVEGDPVNRKITLPSDLAMLKEPDPTRPCTGYGYDVHRYGGTRPLILGGVPIPCDLTVSAHSDGDVLLHALIDAVLGCLGAGDIGRLFPDSDPRWEGISSSILLDQVLDMAAEAGLVLTHADLTIIAQKPKLAPHAVAIRRNVARLLGLDEVQVNVKATTEEGLGFTGQNQGLKAVALVSGLVPALPLSHRKDRCAEGERP